jgi:uncharacterized protein
MSKQLSRRHLLQIFGSAPMLPLAAYGEFAEAADVASARSVKLHSVEFQSMPAPSLANPAEMATMQVGSTLKATFANGSVREFALSYQPFFVSGDMVPDGKGGQILAGGYLDIHQRPIVDVTVPGKERQFFSDAPDGTSLLRVPNAKVSGVTGQTVFAVVQFEYTTRAQDGVTPMYGRLPSPIAVLTLDQNPQSGHLRLVKYHNVDTSKVNGLWITCGASLSPWGTHLSSEEYEPNAFTAHEDLQFKAFSHNLFGDEAHANPYHYGHLPEVTVNPDGSGSIKKHYCLGRLSHELVQVMPDNRTVFMGDDATNSGYFVFVANKEKDLSAGTLYVAQVGEGFSIAPGAAAASLKWIKLGAATSQEIEQLANRLKATDIMELKTTDPKEESFTRIVANGKVEWVKLKPGMEKAAAFLETHRYAALMGASMGFSKMEGTTVNIKDKVAYSALQNCVASMVKGNVANVAGNGIQLPEALNAGAVMALNLKGGMQDTQGHEIRSQWMPSDTRVLLAGKDIVADSMGNTADPDMIANPDNLKFSEKMRTLFIGEDSNQHVNNFLWAYNVDTQKLSRVLSVPSGGESTGLHAVDELNGWTYIMSNFQHAGDWLPIHTNLKAALDPLINANYKAKFGAAVGYLTATPMQVKLNA